MRPPPPSPSRDQQRLPGPTRRTQLLLIASDRADTSGRSDPAAGAIRPAVDACSAPPLGLWCMWAVPAPPPQVARQQAQLTSLRAQLAEMCADVKELREEDEVCECTRPLRGTPWAPPTWPLDLGWCSGGGSLDTFLTLAVWRNLCTLMRLLCCKGFDFVGGAHRRPSGKPDTWLSRAPDIRKQGSRYSPLWTVATHGALPVTHQLHLGHMPPLVRTGRKDSPMPKAVVGSAILVFGYCGARVLCLRITRSRASTRPRACLPTIAVKHRVRIPALGSCSES